MVPLIGLLFLVSRKPASPPIDRDFHEVINGTRLHFRVRGEREKNPYLVLLHGGPGFSGHMFSPWGRSLEKDVNVVYLDQRGCGESAKLRPEDFPLLQCRICLQTSKACASS